ncbi:MAG: hypothetical protein ABFC89_02390, partial [Methanospirillum sp.]
TQYRRYSRTLVQERRRLLAYALVCGDDDWVRTAPVETVLAAVSARFGLGARSTRQRLEAALEDYRTWRTQQEYADRLRAEGRP